MARYTAEQIYAFARDAGFSPDQSATMTAVAMAESGGDSQSHNSHGEDSRGLWQINAAAHPDLGQRFDLYDPAQNAKAAFLVSHGGADVSPWTTTHNGLSARYLRFQEEAQAAAVAHGDGPGLGVWTGTAGYGHPFAAGHVDVSASTSANAAHPSTSANPANHSGAAADNVVVNAHDGPVPEWTGGTPIRPGEDFGIPLDDASADVPADHAADHAIDRAGSDFGIPLNPTAATPPADHGIDHAGDNKLQLFLNAATAQAGDKYVYGYETDLNDPNPTTFDCSELVQWAAHQAGLNVDDGAVYQYRQMHHNGTVISVDQAIHTPGALLFSFNTDPDTTNPSHAHVAISLGDGHTIEARNSHDGVGVFDAGTNRFQYAAMIPGIDAPAPPHAPEVPAAPVIDPNFDNRLDYDPNHLDAQADVPEDPTLHPDGHDLGIDSTMDSDGDGLDDSLAGSLDWIEGPVHSTADADWDHDHHAVH